MKKEKIIIALVVLALLALFYLFNFSNVFTKEKYYTAYFENIGSLQASAHVMINGARVGKVKKVDLADSMIRVDFFTNDNINLPEGTKASVASEDISGAKALVLKLGDGTTSIAKGSTIPAEADTSLKEMFNAKITPVLHNAKSLLYHTDSAMQTFNRLIHGNLGKQVGVAIIDIHNGMQDAATLTVNLMPTINDAATTLLQLSNAVDSPAQKNKNINASLANINKQAEQLASKNYSKELEELSASMNKLGKNFTRISKENRLFNSKKDYQEATKSLDSFNTSLKTYKNNPPPLITIP